jgi:hypothetical protein
MGHIVMGKNEKELNSLQKREDINQQTVMKNKKIIIIERKVI